MGFSIEMLNNIRANASQEYQNRIPEATQANLLSIGMAFSEYDVLYNEFSVALINKIGKTIVLGKLFKNKLAKFKTGTITNQQDVEEIFVDMIKAEGKFDPEGKNPLGRRNQDTTKVVYHRMNRQDYYVITLGDIDFVRDFRSESALDAYIGKKLNAMYSGASYDEWLAMKNVLATFDGYFDYQVPVIAGDDAEATAKSFVKTLRKAVQDVTFPTDKYNKAGVMQWNQDASELVLFVHKDVLAEIDVEVLAKAFNLGKTDIQVEVVSMDDFGSLTNTYGLLVDKDFFRVYDTLFKTEPQRNAQGLFTNHFLHVHQILSASPFVNAIRLTTESEA